MQNAPTARAVGAFHLGLLLAGCAFLSPAFAQTAGGQATPVLAGKVELVEGDVRFFDRAMTVRRPVTEDPIFEGESIATGANGEVHLRMEDGGFIAVRPGTRLRIAKFRAQGRDASTSRQAAPGSQACGARSSRACWRASRRISGRPATRKGSRGATRRSSNGFPSCAKTGASWRRNARRKSRLKSARGSRYGASTGRQNSQSTRKNSYSTRKKHEQQAAHRPHLRIERHHLELAP